MAHITPPPSGGGSSGDAADTNVGTFTNSWVNLDSTNVARFRKDGQGFVHLAGVIRSGTVADSSSGAAFQLPAGYRPGGSYQLIYAVTANSAYGRIDVMSDGNVRCVNGNNAFFSLDGITFYAGA